MYLSKDSVLQGGKYKIVRHISSGGFGNTYEALDVNLDKRVAIKEFFVKDFCSRESDTTLVTIASTAKKPLIEHLKKKFIEEARAIAKMEHENIVKVQALFEENGTAYYVMDYIDGESLNSLLKRRGSLPENEALPIILKVADALGYMHKQNRFHLDVKPANIMLRNDGKVILIDFGSSKQYAEVDGENTTTLAPCYTAGYAPSEQMNPKQTTFTAATDVYALGATLYKMLTGQNPPSAIDLINGEDTLSPMPKGTSKNVKNCLEKAMVPQRNQRTQNIDDFITSLKVDKPRSSGGSRLKKLFIGLAGVGSVAVLFFIFYYIFNWNSSSIKASYLNGVLTIKGVTYDMVLVEGGTFTMGATSEKENPDNDEKPTHSVTLSSYYIGKTEVTQALWKAVMGTNPSHFKGDNLPVEDVSWNDCKKFISKLNSITGQDFRLPTEAEWEFAARGGNKSRHFQYSGSDRIGDVAWYENNSGGKTHTVATKNPNELGLYDMSGNVLEWCSDWYGDYSSSSQTNPKGPSSGYDRVIRGGSWNDVARDCRSSGRSGITPLSGSHLGLRLVLVP